MYVCCMLNVCMYVCLYVCMYVCMSNYLAQAIYGEFFASIRIVQSHYGHHLVGHTLVVVVVVVDSSRTAVNTTRSATNLSISKTLSMIACPHIQRQVKQCKP